VRRLLTAFALALPLGCNGTPSAPPIDGGFLTFSPPGLWLSTSPAVSVEGTVTVRNVGDDSVTISSLNLSSPRSVFSVALLAGETQDLAPSDSTSFVVSYDPPSCLDAGEDLGQMALQDTSGNAPTFTLPLVGLCAAPRSADAGADAGVDGGR
jgi:hypothetical protein